MNLIILNGNIYTMNKENPKAQALFIKDGKFEKIGSNEEISKLIDENTKVIDIDRQTVLPGFIDSHMHLSMLGANLYECNLVGVGSKEELISTVKEYIKEKEIPEGSWVTGKGWNEDYFDVKVLPSRYDLDKISTEHNICLTRGCLHLCVVNSNVLEEFGITTESHEIENGIFDTDENGNPTGICRENAMKFIQSKLPKVTKDDFKDYVRVAQDYVLSRGITSACTDDFMLPGVERGDVIDAYTEMNKDGELKARIYEQCLLPKVEDIKKFAAHGYKTGMGDEHFKIGQIKLLIDGNFGTRTAYLVEPYADDNSTCGMSQYTQEELNDIVYLATDSGFQIAAHAIGDKSIHMLIEAIENLPDNLKEKDIRFNVVHCQVTDDEILKKFKELDIIANIQPIFLNYDLHMAESRLGPERIKKSYNYKTIIDSGIKVAMGSDSPVELPDTVNGIYCAVTRKDLNGFPEGGWYPEEKISVDEAIRSFTIGSAYSSYDENTKGSIEEGKLADFTVLSDDLYEIQPDYIKDVQILKTFVGGELVYELKDNKISN